MRSLAEPHVRARLVDPVRGETRGNEVHVEWHLEPVRAAQEAVEQVDRPLEAGAKVVGDSEARRATGLHRAPKIRNCGFLLKHGP